MMGSALGKSAHALANVGEMAESIFASIWRDIFDSSPSHKSWLKPFPVFDKLQLSEEVLALIAMAVVHSLGYRLGKAEKGVYPIYS